LAACVHVIMLPSCWAETKWSTKLTSRARRRLGSEPDCKKVGHKSKRPTSNQLQTASLLCIIKFPIVSFAHSQLCDHRAGAVSPHFAVSHFAVYLHRDRDRVWVRVRVRERVSGRVMDRVRIRVMVRALSWISPLRDGKQKLSRVMVNYTTPRNGEVGNVEMGNVEVACHRLVLISVYMTLSWQWTAHSPVMWAVDHTSPTYCHYLPGTVAESTAQFIHYIYPLNISMLATCHMNISMCIIRVCWKYLSSGVSC